jgi:hypothetical protein
MEFLPKASTWTKISVVISVGRVKTGYVEVA